MTTDRISAITADVCTILWVLGTIETLWYIARRNARLERSPLNWTHEMAPAVLCISIVGLPFFWGVVRMGAFGILGY